MTTRPLEENRFLFSTVQRTASLRYLTFSP